MSQTCQNCKCGFIQQFTQAFYNDRKSTKNETLKAVNKLGLEVSPHPQYSPDLAPIDYHLFGPVKPMLGKKFASDAEVQSTVLQ